MLAHRETFFRCIYAPSSGGESRQRVAHVTAWDASEAVQLFQAELREDGIDERGTIEVVPLAGGRAARRAYRPRPVTH